MTETSHYQAVMLEEINDHLKLVLEAIEPLRSVPDDLGIIKGDIADLKRWRNRLRFFMKENSKILNNHEKRLTKLEAT